MRHHIIALCSALASFSLFVTACGQVEDPVAAPPTVSGVDATGDTEEPIAEVDEALAPQYVCDSGPSAGQSCTTFHDCASYCNAGPSYLQTCTTSADCQRICTDGPSVGAACTVNTDCGKYCIGNLATLRQPCTASSQCGAGGSCVLPTCGGVGCRGPGCNNPHG